MNCKSCSFKITESSKFCSNCGSKIVDKKLSLKGTWHEFVGPFFSWENNFWKTFFDLFTKPKGVLEAYISGARKKYFQPFSYLILYTTVAIFFYKFFPIEITEELNKNIASGNKVNFGGSTQVMNTKKFMDFIMNYYNFIVVLMMPFYAIVSYFLFKKRENNFAEHLVFNCYITANLGYISLLLQVVLINYFNWRYEEYYVIYLTSYVLYTIYCFKYLYSLSFFKSILTLIKYILWFLLIYFVIIIIVTVVVVIGGFLYGYFISLN